MENVRGHFMWKIYGAYKLLKLECNRRGISKMTILSLGDRLITFLGRVLRIKKFTGKDKQKILAILVNQRLQYIS